MNDQAGARASGTRTAHDSLGDVAVPKEAYFGAQTQRAIENFPVSGLTFPRRFLRAQGLVKLSAARANASLGLIEPAIAHAVEAAAREVAEGRWDGEFRVDVYQAGAGTSQNMNANEVIAGRAAELLGGSRADPAAAGVHANDVVNMAQSTNDTVHVVICVALAEAVIHDVLPALDALRDALEEKAAAFDGILKSGRTHLQDAVPMRLGQEFSGWAGSVALTRAALAQTLPALQEIGMGGTAVGTGLNADPRFGARAVSELARETAIAFTLPASMFAFMQNLDAVAVTSGAMRAVAIGLTKLANDLRLLSSGPRNGLFELVLPSLQPGSSIMPGKVNPVMAEMLNMVCYQVMGLDQTVAQAVTGGQLELNVMMPVIGYNALMAAQILGGGVRVFTERCVRGIEANRAKCEETIERSTSIVTALNPVIGYDRAAEIAKQAFREGRTVREVLRDSGILSEEEIVRHLDVRAMTGPEL